MYDVKKTSTGGLQIFKGHSSTSPSTKVLRQKRENLDISFQRLWLIKKYLINLLLREDIKHNYVIFYKNK